MLYPPGLNIGPMPMPNGILICKPMFMFMFMPMPMALRGKPPMAIGWMGPGPDMP
jgi:hypothetical protein